MAYPHYRVRHPGAAKSNGATSNGNGHAAQDGTVASAPRKPSRAPRVFEPQYPAGASPFVALRPTAPRASSFSDGMTDKLNAFAGREGNGRWPNLPRAGIAARLQTL